MAKENDTLKKEKKRLKARNDELEKTVAELRALIPPEPDQISLSNTHTQAD